MITVDVSNIIMVTGLSPEIRKAVIEKFSLPNAAYLNAIKLKKSTFRIAKYICYVYECGDVLYLPRGLAEYVEKLLKHMASEKWTWNKRPVMQGATFKSTIELRDYQVPIVDTVVAKLESPLGRETGGLIEMGTGTGKTAVSLAIAARLGVTTTIVVPNLTLASQWVADIIRWFPELHIGKVFGSQSFIFPLTVATWQSIAKTPELYKHTSLLIVDEANSITAPGRRAILQQFNPSFTLGLTATPDRTDGQGMGIRYLLGPTLAKYEKTELIPAVEIIRSEVELPMLKDKRGIIDYNAMVDAMVGDTNRNQLIAGLAMGEMLKGRKVLVLTKRIAHYEALRDVLPAFDGMYFIDSKDKGRHDLLKAFKEGTQSFNAIFGTTSLLAVGTDIPALDTIIIACDISSEVLLTQSVGRILRLFEGKPEPKIIDISDKNGYWDDAKQKFIVTNPVFYNQFQDRKNLYIKKGWFTPDVYTNKKSNNFYGQQKKDKYYKAKGSA